MAPFDFNYVQDDMLSAVTDRAVTTARSVTTLPESLIPSPAKSLSGASNARNYLTRDNNLTRAAAGRAAAIHYDTDCEVEHNSFAEILLEFLDKNATLTSIGFIICYVGLLRSL
jgi:hypothetical protein